MTSPLDGGIRKLFGRVFAPIYLHGTLIATELIDDGVGGWTETETSYPILAQRDRTDETMRRSPQYDATDAKFLVLQEGATRAPTTDDKLILIDQEWTVFQVGDDPARSFWRVHAKARRTVPDPETGGTA